MCFTVLRHFACHNILFVYHMSHVLLIGTSFAGLRPGTTITN